MGHGVMIHSGVDEKGHFIYKGPLTKDGLGLFINFQGDWSLYKTSANMKPKTKRRLQKWGRETGLPFKVDPIWLINEQRSKVYGTKEEIETIIKEATNHVFCDERDESGRPLRGHTDPERIAIVGLPEETVFDPLKEGPFERLRIEEPGDKGSDDNT